MFHLDPVNKAPLEDDDIVAGYQKMSLKCPVGSAVSARVYWLTCFTAELYAHHDPVSCEDVSAPTVFRCHVVVFSHGADNDMDVSRLREGSERGRPDH